MQINVDVCKLTFRSNAQIEPILVWIQRLLSAFPNTNPVIEAIFLLKTQEKDKFSPFQGI